MAAAARQRIRTLPFPCLPLPRLLRMTMVTMLEAKLFGVRAMARMARTARMVGVRAMLLRSAAQVTVAAALPAARKALLLRLRPCALVAGAQRAYCLPLSE